MAVDLWFHVKTVTPNATRTSLGFAGVLFNPLKQSAYAIAHRPSSELEEIRAAFFRSPRLKRTLSDRQDLCGFFLVDERIRIKVVYRHDVTSVFARSRRWPHEVTFSDSCRCGQTR